MLKKVKTKKKTNEEKLKEIAELKKAIAEKEAEEPEELEEDEEPEEEVEDSPTDEEEEVPEIDPKIKERIVVVKELPVQPVRSYVEKDGTVINMITVEEALSKLFESESSEK